MARPRALARRALLAGSLLAPLAASPARADEHGRLLVAGPPGGDLDALAAALRPALLRGPAAEVTMEVRAAGGEDGVTGANQFQAWFAGEGDGTPLLLLPGAVAVSWLVGDPRAAYDVARWLPLLCGIGSGVLASRRGVATARAADPWRVAVADPPGAAAPCMLGLDLLAIPARPHACGDPAAALAAGRVDAAFLHGRRAALAAASGASAIFSLGALDIADGRDPAWPEVPTLDELVAASRSSGLPLARALRAASAAAVLDFALVIPALTPAAAVAVWRAASARLADAPELRTALPAGVRPIGAPGCAEVLAAISVAPEVLLAYRSWLGERLAYRPG